MSTFSKRLNATRQTTTKSSRNVHSLSYATGCPLGQPVTCDCLLARVQACALGDWRLAMGAWRWALGDGR